MSIRNEISSARQILFIEISLALQWRNRKQGEAEKQKK